MCPCILGGDRVEFIRIGKNTSVKELTGILPTSTLGRTFRGSKLREKPSQRGSHVDCILDPQKYWFTSTRRDNLEAKVDWNKK